MNVRHGGFSLTNEMAKKEKDWKLGEVNDYESDKHDLVRIAQDHWVPPSPKDGFDSRTNPDLIECVLTLQKLHENDDFHNRYYSQLFALQVVDVQVNLEIEDRYDGIETVSVWSHTDE